MKLKKLILHGFKSFADKTEFDFEDGITVIVGPNGCGKSNVVDAVKWVLGEQRPSSLRGKEMQDVIFSGTDSRKGVGFAEVTLVFDNAAGRLPIDYEEVSITRRLYRSGESEYLINGNTCRLRDIRELLMDSGGGPGAMTIMEQGNIDRLLRADPAERRLVFEEAAGIAKYRARRKETERKLERTLENLERLRDLLGEYETRQRSLKIQAGKARRWKELTEELKRKRLSGALARYSELARRRDAARAELDGVARLESEARTSLADAMERDEGGRRELDGLRAEVAKGEAEMAALVGEGRAAEEKRAARERESKELLERSASADRESAEAGERAVALGRDLEQARAEQERAGGEKGARLDALQAAEALLNEVEQRVLVLRKQRDELDAQRTDAFALETEARNDEVSAEAELRALRSRLARLEAKARTGGEELVSLEAAREEAALAVRAAEERLRALEDRHAAAEEAARDARAAIEEAVQQEKAKGGEAADLAARHEVLGNLVREGEGLTNGTRALLESGLDGVAGTLADRIGDAGPLAGDLDQALGDLAGAVVVDTTAQALKAIAWLREGQRGRARLIPLDRVGAAEPPERFRALPPGAARLVGALLRGTRIVSTVEEALAATGERVLVLGGEEFEPTGAIAGGAGESGRGLVVRHAELARVDGSLAAAELARDEAAARADVARDSARQWEATLEELRPELRRARDEVRLAGEGLAAAQKAAASRADEQDLETAERSDVERLIAECEERAAGARGRRGEAETRREALDAEAQDLRERLTRAGRDREDAASRRTEAKVEAARWTEKAEASELRARSLAEAIAAAQREQETRAEEARACRERRTACLDEIEVIGRLAAEREKAIDKLGRVVEAKRTAARDLEASLQEGGRRVRELREMHERHREELERHRLKENELRLRIETLLEEVRRDHGLELDRVEAEEEEPKDAAALEQEIQELREKLERLGNVNHAALEELAEVEQKLEFLRREEADLLSADKQLRETIEKIDEVCTTRFTETFERIRENFHVVFRKLFGGGRAEISLEDPEDVLGSGIEIRVRPPGKELRNMALLSGGEKSLTTVALLFSIYQTKPPPFCLLDEVDAALDEANTVRMCEMLKDFALKGQFLVITHARPTMTVADTLYGVTMPEAGVSRRVAVRFQDIEAGRVVGLN